jgi:predicted adenylyl cyclase CyaB
LIEAVGLRALASGQVGCVRKKRVLFLLGRTRIHLDRVEDLGEYFELEVVLKEGEDLEAGEAIAKDIMSKLGVLPNQLVEVAYIDLLKK